MVVPLMVAAIDYAISRLVCEEGIYHTSLRD